MKIAFLTSSRADYGIYFPLLKALNADPAFDIRMIAFGTHLSPMHGYTINTIKNDGFTVDYEVEHVLTADSEEAIATSMAIVFLKFASIWEREKSTYDLVFCLGDRYEMFAAVSAATPYGMSFAHIHGGETTLGAIDNEFRHCITVFSKIHFTATEQYADRVAAIKGSKDNIYNVGSLSLQNLKDIDLLSKDDFQKKYDVDVSRPIILVTYHPETVNLNTNKENAKELVKALEKFNDYSIVITMPNADPRANSMRNVFEAFARGSENVTLIENFGTQGYFSCMNFCSLVVGNSSSGIIEAASFKKFTVNIGDRQKGRVDSGNVFNCAAISSLIFEACKKALESKTFNGSNAYYRENTVEEILKAIKK